MKKLNRRQLQAQERRGEILAAAKKLFAQNGYHATTTRSINKEVGMADGLLYHYFPEGKMQILQAVLQEEVDRKRKSLLERLQMIDPQIGLEKLLIEVGRIILEAATRDRELLIISLKESNIIKSKFNEPIVELSGFIQYVEKLLQSYIERGEIKPLNPRFMAVQFISPLSLYIMTSVLLADSEDLISGMDEETFLQQNVRHTLETWKK